MSLNLSDEQKIILLGSTGGISSGFIAHPTIQEVIRDGKVAAMVNSTSAILGQNQIQEFSDLSASEYYSKKKKLKTSRKSPYMKEKGVPLNNINGLVDFVDSQGVEPVVVDLTNGNLLEEHLYLARKGFKIATANKIPLATSSNEEFHELVGDNYGGEATVLGGQGIYGDVEDNHNAGINIESIEGVFSGTMGYIMSELEKGRKLSEIIEEAMDAGYTEPNPMDDLDGLDVAKKLVILARRAGHNVNIDDVKVKGLLGDEYRRFFENGVTPEAKKAFIKEVKDKEDKKVEERIKDGGSLNVLRFIAEFKNTRGKVKLSVGASSVEKESAIGGLKGTDNIAVRKSEIDTKQIIGPGAGIETTSANVLMNLHKILQAR